MNYIFEGEKIAEDEFEDFVRNYLEEHYDYDTYEREMRDNCPDSPITEEGYAEELADRIAMTLDDPETGFIIGITEKEEEEQR